MTELLQSLANQLAGAGVKNAFGISGSGATWKLITALEAHGVTYVNASHEGSAAIMAGACTRAWGKPAVSLSIKGPGLVNAVGGIAFNHFECTPSISIAEAFGSETPASRMHKRVDQTALLRPLVKRSATLEQVAGGSDVAQLLSCARAEVPGPVHIDLCMGSIAAPGHATVPADAPASSDSGAPFDQLLKRVAAAQQPVVIAGSLATRRAWGAQLRSLRIPVFTTGAARGVVDESAPFSAGIYTGDGKALARETDLLKRADLVVCLGLRCAEVTGARAPAGNCINVDDTAARALPLLPGLEAHTAYVDDAAITHVLQALGAREWGSDHIAQQQQSMRAALLKGPWLPAHCFAALDSHARPHGLVLDTGSFCTIGEHMWRATAQRMFVASNNGRFMGGGLPSAVGAAMGGGTHPWFCALGDGGMQAYPAELKTIAARTLPVCVLFMTDGRYGSIACAGTPAMARDAVDFPSPSWAKAAESMGVAAVRCTEARAFERAISDWDARAPLFVECAFDPDAYLVMTKELR